MNDNYVCYHLHSDSGSLLDSATKFTQYIDKAKSYGMKAIGFSEHGNVMNWVKKKQEIEKRGMKYLHCLEAYVTENNDEKVRDNYHMLFIAKNLDGVKELNRMSSKAFKKEDNHFYYDARFTLEEVMNTSDNILITTSCLGGILAKGKRLNKQHLINRFLDFAVKNKHRIFLELQYHLYPEQIEYNQYLYDLSIEHGFHLIVGTDTHSLDEKYAKARKILMMAKGIKFQDEDKFDLTFKSYDELVHMFEIQNSLPMDVILKAIDFTNIMSDMVDEFELDKSAKYPKMSDDPVNVFKEKINAGVLKRGMDQFEKEKRKEYFSRIHEEFDVYQKLNAIDYMLFQKDVIDYANSIGIYQGYGRGSVTGSLIAYIIGITEMDSIKHKLNFFRFMNPDRISLADIDVDFPPSKRQEIIDYVASRPNIYFSEIVTFNTIALKGAIREVGRALEIPLDVIDEIAKNVESKESHYRKKHPELFEYVDLLSGVNVSLGSHPSGFLVSPVPIDESVGTFYTSESKYPVSQVNMKELDGLNFVKLDILGLNNIETINDTCELAGIERFTPDNIDVNDENVWQSMRESTLAIFQWESNSAFHYYKQLFRLETIDRIKKQNPNFSYIDLFSIGNGAIRPSGDSYRNDLANGIFKDNGHPALNEFLNDTFGYLIYQEQIQNFLTEFCGFTKAQSDSVRRGLAKKEGTEKFLPSIESGFLKTMKDNYNEEEGHAKKILQSFLQVISDASDYGFSLNHSASYSFIGYVCAYLRYYYPLEFLTALLNNNDDDIEKTGEIVQFAQSKRIAIKSIRFRKSLANYSPSKEENAIYKGLKSIKFLNAIIAEELYSLRETSYDSFIDCLVDVIEKTSCNSRQIDILIKLGFFEEFGSVRKLMSVYEEFKKQYKKTHKPDTKLKRIALLTAFESTVKEAEFPVYEQILFEREMLGYADLKYPEMDSSYYVILEIDTKFSPKLTLYRLKDGIEKTFKMQKNIFFRGEDTLLDVGNVIKINRIVEKQKSKRVNGKWEKLDETELWLESCSLIRKN